jgi:hypothetical protein
MNGEFYIEIMGCVLITAFTGLVVGLAIWYANFVYHDIAEKRRWRNRR